jgi:hypothetical protein
MAKIEVVGQSKLETRSSSRTVTINLFGQLMPAKLLHCAIHLETHM